MKDMPLEIVVVDSSATVHDFFRYALQQLSVDLQDKISLKNFLTVDESMPYFLEHRPALLFLDIMIQGEDVFSLLHNIRDIRGHEDLPVAVISTKDYEQDKVVANQLGVVEFIIKPMPARLITNIIKRYLVVS